MRWIVLKAAARQFETYLFVRYLHLCLTRMQNCCETKYKASFWRFLPDMNDMNRVDAIYARQSIDKNDSISIESQIDFCRFETRGAPCRVYRDKGYSGKNTARPEFQKMLQAVRNGEIKRVICYKLDRCSRSILDFANLMEEFQTYRVEFVSCTEKFDTSTPIGRAMLNICIVFAQLERETIQQRVFDAYHARNIRGFYMGGRTPFGFVRIPFELEGKKTSCYAVKPEEAVILELMYGAYEKPDTSLSDVVRMLERSGVSHPRNGRWSRAHIGRMLRNPIYVKADQEIYHYFQNIGTVIHDPPEDFVGTNGCYLYSDNGKPERHLVLAPHPGIVASDIWLRCRKKQKRYGRPARQRKIKNTWLAGKIKCALCGYAVVVQKTVKTDGREFRYLRCSEANCKGLRGIKANEIENVVFDQLKEKLDQFPMAPAADPRTTEISNKIAAIDQQIRLAVAKTIEASGPLVQYLSEKVAALELERSACIAALSVSEGVENCCQSFADCLVKWEILTMEDKLAVVDALIDRILLSEQEVTIYWKV